MLSLVVTTIFFSIVTLTSLCAAEAIQVGLALRSDAVVLVQLATLKSINYTIQQNADQDYRDFMAMMRHDQTDLSYLHEDDLYLQKYFPIFNRTLTHPAHPTTNFHYAHLISRNIRPLIRKAELELRRPVKCDAIVIPSYGSDHDFRPFVRLASELAGCGSLGYSQIPGLHRIVLFAYDLDLINGLRSRPYGPKSRADRYSLLIEVEPSHIRIGAINVMPGWVKAHCAHTCDREVASVVESILKCAVNFKKHCLVDDGTSGLHFHGNRVKGNDLKQVFVSGTIGLQQRQIEEAISTQFGRGVLNDLSFGIDPEILGAYGAACWARISGEVDYLREYDTWDMPAFSDPDAYPADYRGSADFGC